MLAPAKLYKIIATARPNFLILTPCCLSLALAYVLVEQILVNYPNLILVVTGALAAHASVNMFNEYRDFTSGLDLDTQRTPFSGGSGTLPATPELAESVWAAAVFSLLVTIAIGLYLVWAHGWGLLPVGLLGIVLIYFYTHKITRSPWLCLIAPGLAFGPLMIGGAYYVLSGHYGLPVFAASLVVFFLVNNLLLLNQFPDAEADRRAGRLHAPIVMGRKKAAWIYVSFLAAAYVTLLASVWLSFLPPSGLLALLPVPLAVFAAKTAVRHAEHIEKLRPALALNVVITLTTPLLMAAGVLLWARV